MRMKDIPELERPREKAMRYGFEKLSDNELLAIVINSGNHKHSALDIASDLLAKGGGLYNLDALSQKDLKTVKGISKVKSIQLQSLFYLMRRIKERKLDIENNPVTKEDIYERYHDYFNNIKQEVVKIIVLNRSKKIIYEATLYRGSSYLVPIEINKVIEEVIGHGGYYFYVLHNHPSGFVKPSPQDLLLTLRLKESIKKLKIYLIDHLIFYCGGYTSIKDYISSQSIRESIETNGFTGEELFASHELPNY